MSRRLILAATLLTASTGFAGAFDFGTYPGSDQNGKNCEVQFGSAAGYVNNYPGGAQGRVSLVRVVVFGEDFMILDKATLGPEYQSNSRFDQTPSGTLQLHTGLRTAKVTRYGETKTCFY